MFGVSRSRNGKSTVLVVEDNHRQRELLTTMLEETGLYCLETAANGVDAFAVLELYERGFNFLSNGIACIVLDWQMPQMSGKEFLSTLRQKEHKSLFKYHIPVIIITAISDPALRSLAEDSTSGLVSAYLLKPVDENELLSALKQIVYDKEAEIMRELLIEQRSRGDMESKRPMQE